MFVNRQLGKLHTGVCKLMPVDDYRKKGCNIPYFKSSLLTSAFIEKYYDHYRYEKIHAPFWIPFFENGYSTCDVYAITIPECFIAGRGIIVSKQKRIILESALFQYEYLYKLRISHLLLKNLLFAPALQVNHIIPLLNKLSNNYFHWTAENLSRIALLAEKDNTIFKRYSLLLSESAPAFVIDSLKHLIGWPEHKIIKWKNEQSATVSDCLLISYPAVRNKGVSVLSIYAPEIFILINRLAFANIPLPLQTYQCFIISRSKAASRKLINEAIVAEKINSVNLQIIHPEELNFVQQVQLFMNAKLIIAPHGSGLTNLVYCRQHSTTVIELFPGGRNYNQTSCFYQISKALNIQHHIIEVASINNNEDMIAGEEIINKVENIIAGIVTPA